MPVVSLTASAISVVEREAAVLLGHMCILPINQLSSLWRHHVIPPSWWSLLCTEAPNSNSETIHVGAETVQMELLTNDGNQSLSICLHYN